MSYALKYFVFQVNIINNMCYKNTFSNVFGSNLDCFSLHSTHLSSIILVSMYDNPSLIISLELAFLYIFNDSKTCDD